MCVNIWIMMIVKMGRYHQWIIKKFHDKVQHNSSKMAANSNTRFNSDHLTSWQVYNLLAKTFCSLAEDISIKLALEELMRGVILKTLKLLSDTPESIKQKQKLELFQNTSSLLSWLPESNPIQPPSQRVTTTIERVISQLWEKNCGIIKTGKSVC